MWIHCKGQDSINLNYIGEIQSHDHNPDGPLIVFYWHKDQEPSEWSFDTAEERDAVHQNICSQIGVTVQPGMVQYRIDWSIEGNGPTEDEMADVLTYWRSRR